MAGSRRRTLVLALLAMLGAAGCKDSGLPDRNLPLEEARHRVGAYPVYQMAGAIPGTPQLITMNETTWALQAPPAYYSLGTASVPSRLLRAGGGDAVLSTMVWDETPFDRLYAGAGAPMWTYERVH